MGVIFICIAIFFIGYFIYNKIEEIEPLGVLLIVISIITATICIIAISATAIIAPNEFPGCVDKATSYQAYVDNINNNELSSDDNGRVYLEIIDFNQKILNERNAAHSFWTMGFSSPLWDKVPLVDLHLN